MIISSLPKPVHIAYGLAAALTFATVAHAEELVPVAWAGFQLSPQNGITCRMDGRVSALMDNGNTYIAEYQGRDDAKNVVIKFGGIKEDELDDVEALISQKLSKTPTASGLPKEREKAAAERLYTLNEAISICREIVPAAKKQPIGAYADFNGHKIAITANPLFNVNPPPPENNTTPGVAVATHTP